MAITAAPYIVNPSFEDATINGWSVSGRGTAIAWSIDTAGANASNGTQSVRFSRTTGGKDYTNSRWEIVQSDFLPVTPGQSFTASCDIKPTGERDEVGGSVGVVFRSADLQKAQFFGGSQVAVHQGQNYRTSNVSVTVPDWAARAEILGSGWIVRANGVVWVDNFRTSYTFGTTASLTSPGNGTTYAFGASVPLRVTLTGASAVTAVRYYYTNGVDPAVLIGSGASPGWGLNSTTIPSGTWTVYAEVDVSGITLTTNTISFTVGAVPAPITREYKASNAYTYLMLENFSGLGESMPSTAKVTGVEFDVEYMLEILSRTKDLAVTNPALARDTVPFEITSGGVLEVIMMKRTGDGLEQVGLPSSYEIAIVPADFREIETGISENKKWTVRRQDLTHSVDVGGEEFLWGQTPIDASDFRDISFGFRFYPTLTSKPAYAAAGDACYRFFFDRVRIRVYFNAGSVEYYFASPDRTEVIKGTLTSVNVFEGDLRSADASGILQLTPTLEVMDGFQTWIGNDWTIHAAYPPTDSNYIGDVGSIDGLQEIGMEYNGLPTQKQVKDNRSRYQFITENFYGDPQLNSMYGVHGLARAFAYNGTYFYKIVTQPDEEKDSPRSVANHHGHLALGFHGGRVDISVVGEPYNFDGLDGASSWAFGDKVVGLLPLSGTILGVFGSKSIWGISGTTVDNFATQVISPNIGAIEYTICDMGFPVYANAYGIYTLSQTQQYGDYLGEPMSKDISPWLRPRLLRKPTSNKEVVCAFPVRSKNQYRLCFSDGYVTSMTLNGQQVPTFSFQKYFYGSLPEEADLYSYPAIVPAAVSSELDNHGEERIHISPYVEEEEAVDEICTDVEFDDFGSGMYAYTNNMPSWYEPGSGLMVVVARPGHLSDYVQLSESGDNSWTTSDQVDWLPNPGEVIDGLIAILTDDSPENFNWSCARITVVPPQ